MKKNFQYKEYYSNLKRKTIRLRLIDILIFLWVIMVLLFIGYRSYDGYGIESRDELRKEHLIVIQEWLNKLRKEWKTLPDAYKKKEIIVNNSIIGAQGFAWEDFFSAIGSKVLKDPLDKTYYTYAYDPESGEYEVLAYMENNSWTTNRTPYTVWMSWHILLGNIGNYKNIPLNTLTDSSNINITDLNKSANMFYMGKSCQDILLKFPEMLGKDGNQSILIGNKITKVYCDMSTDNWGWTLFYANNGHSNSIINESYVQMREKMRRWIYNLSDYNNPNLAGLLNTTHFTWNWAKDILIKNKIGEVDKWIKFSFDTSENLNWALGKEVLGWTNSGCYSLPNNWSWSIINNDGSTKYTGLKEMMNHKWTSWWISHDNYTCNNQTKAISPHIAFYIATSNTSDWRIRWSEWIDSIQWKENEYRYFIR